MESKILKLAVAVIGMAAFGAFGDIVPTTLREMYDTNTLYTASQVDQKIAEETSEGASTNYVNEATNEVYKSAVAYADGATNAIGSIIRPLEVIPELIPAQASPTNQLADKAFVNSSIATSTATFCGTSDATNQVEFVEWLEAISTANDNDYVFWQTEDGEGNTVYKRYKYVSDPNGLGEEALAGHWLFEYDLNNSSFTAVQWAAINSGITSGDVTKLAGIAAGAQVNVIEEVKVNGTALTPTNKVVDVVAMPSTATGADIPVDATQGAQKINAALNGKLDNTGLQNDNGTLRAVSFNTDGLFIFNGEFWLDVPATSGPALTAGDLENPDSSLYQSFSGKANRASPTTAGNLAALDASGNPTDSGLSKDDVEGLFFALDSKVAGERCTTSGTWCVNDGIMGTDIIFSTGAFSESTTPNNNINNGYDVRYYIKTALS